MSVFAYMSALTGQALAGHPDRVLGLRGWAQAGAIAALAAFAGVVTHEPSVAVAVIVAGVVALPLDAGILARRGSSDKDRAEDHDLSRLEGGIRAYRAGRLAAGAALDSYAGLADWEERHCVDRDLARDLLEEAIEVSRRAGDWTAMTRFQARLALLDQSPGGTRRG